MRRLQDLTKLRYLHIRPRTQPRVGETWPFPEEGEVSPKGGMTVAYIIDGRIAHVSTAITSKKDVYCKDTGRRLARARFSVGEHIMLPARNSADLRRYFDIF